MNQQETINHNVDFECPICFENYNQPQDIYECLYCKKLICNSCVINIFCSQDNNIFKCPCCREEINIDLDSILYNNNIQNIKDFFILLFGYSIWIQLLFVIRNL